MQNVAHDAGSGPHGAGADAAFVLDDGTGPVLDNIFFLVDAVAANVVNDLRTGCRVADAGLMARNARPAKWLVGSEGVASHDFAAGIEPVHG